MGPSLGLVIYTDDNTPNLLDIVDVGPTLSRVIYTDDDTPNLLDVVDVGPTLGRVLYTDDDIHQRQVGSNNHDDDALQIHVWNWNEVFPTTKKL